MKRSRIRVALPLLVAVAMTLGIMIRSSDGRAGSVVPTYSIDFYTIAVGGSSLRNSCFVLHGTVGQALPGSASTSDGTTYSVYTGFWSAAPTTGLDEIFFTGFEEC